MTKWFLAAATAACVSTAAVAGISFNPATGTGFIGKGDVQSALGLNNPQLQALYLSGGITFKFSQFETWQITCSWIKDDGKTEPVTKNLRTRRTRGVNATLNAQGRDISSGINGPNTGFILNGFNGGGTTDEPIPNVGDACIGGDPATPVPATISAVTLLSSDSSGLTVNGVTIWP
jgi:hypothetical protein